MEPSQEGRRAAESRYPQPRGRVCMNGLDAQGREALAMHFVRVREPPVGICDQKGSVTNVSADVTCEICIGVLRAWEMLKPWDFGIPDEEGGAFSIGVREGYLTALAAREETERHDKRERCQEPTAPGGEGQSRPTPAPTG